MTWLTEKQIIEKHKLTRAKLKFLRFGRTVNKNNKTYIYPAKITQNKDWKYDDNRNIVYNETNLLAVLNK
jgi:hypothetical protein